MKFLSIEVPAFMRLHPFTLDLSRPGLVQVIGENLDRGGTEDRSNMSGKSLAIVEPLPWCLFGRMVRYGERVCKAEAQHHERGAYVRVHAEEGGHSYVIERFAALTASTRFQVLDGVTGQPVPLSRDLNRRVDEATELIGLDYAAFRHAFVIRSADSFPAATFAVQMATLESILRLSDLSEASDVARTLSTATSQRVSLLDVEVAGYVRQITTLKDTLLAIEQPSVIADRVEQIRLLLEEIKDLEQTADKGPALREVIAGTTSEVQRYDREVWDAQARLQAIAREQQQEQQAMQSDTCPTCSRAYPNAKAVKEHNQRHQKRLDALATEASALAKKQQTARGHSTSVTTRLRAQQAELERITQSASEIETKRATVVEIERWITDRDNQAAVMRQQIAEVERTLAAVSERRTAEAQAGARQAFWVAGFGRDGLQATIFANAVPVLNREALHASQVLTDGAFEVQFNPRRGSRREDLIKIHGASAPTFDGCSGGEQDRITLICAWSLRALARWRLPEPFNIAAYDEIFDRMDAAGLRAASSFLVEESKTAKVFVITHNEGLKHMLPFTSTIKVTRSGGEATVEEIG